jgi:hypothetical protein
MAKKQSTSRRSGKADEAAFLEKFALQFKEQPPQITPDQCEQMETKFVDNTMAILRRVALASLTRSGSELVEVVTAERDMAIQTERARNYISDYAKRLRSFADMMESASTRMGIALCYREDMQTLMEQVKAEDSGQVVGHA